MQETNRSDSSPSWPGIGQVARPRNSQDVCRTLRAVARGTRAHQQSWEPPGSSCCSSLLAGGFWQATDAKGGQSSIRLKPGDLRFQMGFASYFLFHLPFSYRWTLLSLKIWELVNYWIPNACLCVCKTCNTSGYLFGQDYGELSSIFV